MKLTKSEYIPRIIDEKIDRYLHIFGAISIEGPKWCGKTWTALNHAESVIYMTEKSNRDNANINPKYIFLDNKPELIDEWQLVPKIWDAVRHECDEDTKKGKFILTGSTSLEKSDEENENNKVFHSGAGRIATIHMEPMSLFESGDSKGIVSLMDMYNDTVKCGYFDCIELDELADLILRGGWPANIKNTGDDAVIIPRSYLDSVINKDIHERMDRKRDPNKMRMLLRSLARNEATVVADATLVSDIKTYENTDELLESRQTVSDYLGVLNSLYLIYNQEAFITNYRSSKRIGKSSKRHFADPSLACAALELTKDKLLKDHNTLGFMFEGLVERDLKIYIESLEGHLYHFRDNSSGDEVDAILEFKNGDYAAIEIKLSYQGVEEAKQSLQKFYDNVLEKPVFMAVVVGYQKAIAKDPKTGIYIIPITALKN